VASIGRKLRVNRKQDDLVEWYAQEVRRHYTHFQLPLLSEVRDSSTRYQAS